MDETAHPQVRLEFLNRRMVSIQMERCFRMVRLWFQFIFGFGNEVTPSLRTMLGNKVSPPGNFRFEDISLMKSATKAQKPA